MSLKIEPLKIITNCRIANQIKCRNNVVPQNQKRQDICETKIQISHKFQDLELCFRRFKGLQYKKNAKEFFLLKRTLERRYLPQEPLLKNVIDLFEQGSVQHVSYSYTTDIHDRPNSPFILSIEHGKILPDWENWEPNKIPDHETLVKNFPEQWRYALSSELFLPTIHQETRKNT